MPRRKLSSTKPTAIPTTRAMFVFMFVGGMVVVWTVQLSQPWPTWVGGLFILT